MKSPHPLKTLIVGLMALLATNFAFGQEKFNISAGVGFPELLNLGLRYQFGQSQVGLYRGSIPFDEDDGFSAGIDYYYHFGGTSKLTSRRPWFAKAGLNYNIVKEPYNENSSVLLVPRIGREINISRRIGIDLEVGLFFRLARSGEEYEPGRLSPWAGGNYDAIGQSFSVSVFYRL